MSRKKRLPDSGPIINRSHTDLNVDTIVDITPERAKLFGVKGKMLQPSVATVAALIEQVPAGKLVTTDLLRRVLAHQFDVEITSPTDTRRVLRALADDPNTTVPFWRVLKGSGELLSSVPGSFSVQADLLIAEGFSLDTKGKLPRVINFRDFLMRFDSEYSLPEFDQ